MNEFLSIPPKWAITLKLHLKIMIICYIMWTLVDLAFPELLENLLVHAEIVYIWYVAKLES